MPTLTISTINGLPRRRRAGFEFSPTPTTVEATEEQAKLLAADDALRIQRPSKAAMSGMDDLAAEAQELADAITEMQSERRKIAAQLEADREELRKVADQLADARTGRDAGRTSGDFGASRADAPDAPATPAHHVPAHPHAKPATPPAKR